MKSIIAKISCLSLSRVAGMMSVCLLPLMGIAQESLPGNVTVKSLALEYDVVRGKLIKPIRDLQQGYQTQLEALRDKMQSVGDLEKTLAVKNELDGFRKGKAQSDDRDFPELRRLQSIYVREASHRLALANRKLPGAVSTYKSNLAKLQKQLTKQGNLEEAAMAQKAQANVDESLGIIIPGALERMRISKPAIVEWQGATKPFDEGELQFTNRGYVWADIPREFRGWQMSMQAGGSKVDSKIKVKTRGVVYAVIDPDAEKIFEKEGWKIIELLLGGVKGRQEYHLAEKAFEPGDYTLSGEGWFMTTRILLAPLPED